MSELCGTKSFAMVLMLGLLVGSVAGAASTEDAGRKAPNVVIILADDMGFSDVGCYGGEIRTLNIDGLAKDGVRLAQFYNNARCCPTRAALLTGMYPHQVGVGAMCQDLGDPHYRGELSAEVATIAERLKRSGYQTGMVGKWHLSNLTIGGANKQSKRILSFQVDAPISPSRGSWPCNRGFEEHWGTIAGVGSFFDPYSLVHNEQVITPGKDFYYTDFINDQAVELIEGFAGKSKPFFLYVAETAPHWPMQAREEDIAKYEEVYTAGWDRIREQRYARQVEMGLIDPRWKLSARNEEEKLSKGASVVGAWERAPEKKWQARRMAVYAAMVERMDRGIGRILEKLRERGLERDTLVMFMSDNGACAENVGENWYDIPNRTRDGRTIRVGNDPTVMPGDETTFQSYGAAWANASNTPFRRFKHWAEEGGIATPLVVRWPGGVSKKNEIVRDAVGHVMDVVPTCLEAAGVKGAEELEGRSLLGVLRGDRAEARQLFWEHEGNRAVRDGKWKLVAAHGEEWQLYDLSKDRTELHDRAGEDAERVKKMTEIYAAWAKRCGVREWPVRKAGAGNGS
ncbi:MAG TPA: arylsulfatase [Tepidisphaeraceae bacterium]